MCRNGELWAFWWPRRSLALVVWSSTIGAVAGPNLTRPGASVAEFLGIPPLSGPFVFSAVAAAVAAAVLFVALRPDPLASNGSRGRNLRVGWEVLKSSPQARFGVATVAFSHAVMVSLMAMTPVRAFAGDGLDLRPLGPG